MTTLSIQDFSQAIHQAYQDKHKEVRADQNGKLVTSSPNRATRLVRFIKTAIFKQQIHSTPAETKALIAFKNAIISERGSQSAFVFEKKLSEYNVQKKPITREFYASVLNDLNKQQFVQDLDKMAISSQLDKVLAQGSYATGKTWITQNKQEVVDATLKKIDLASETLREQELSSHDILPALQQVLKEMGQKE